MPTPIAARRLGIETVYQDLALANVLDPAANLFMDASCCGREVLGKLGFTDKREMRRQTADAFEALVSISLPRLAPSLLSLVASDKASPVARAVTWASKVVFLDEPTAALAAMQTANVLELVRRVADNGLAVALISHDLTTGPRVADRHRGAPPGPSCRAASPAQMPQPTVCWLPMTGGSCKRTRSYDRPPPHRTRRQRAPPERRRPRRWRDSSGARAQSLVLRYVPVSHLGRSRRLVLLIVFFTIENSSAFFTILKLPQRVARRLGHGCSSAFGLTF